MQALLGSALLRSVQPGEKPFEIRDTRLKGLLLRVQPSGVMAYYVEYARGKRVSLGRADAVTAAEARDRAKEILADVYQGKDPVAVRKEPKAHTLRSFIDEEYAPWAEANISSNRNTLWRMRANFKDLLDLKLSDLTALAVERWRTERLKAGVKPSTVNRDLDDLKSSMAKAAEWGFLTENPVGSVKRTRVDDRATVRFLDDGELARLLAALNEREERIRAERDRANAWRTIRAYPLLPDLRQVPFADHLKPMVVLSLHTGVRYGELVNLTWADLNLDKGILTVHGFKAKSKRTRHIPLNATARDTLQAWRPQCGAGASLVFANRNGAVFNNVRKSWEGVLAKAGIDRFRWHDLRHTFASRLVMAGVDLNTVRELLGHSDYKMTLRYAHLAPEHKAAAVARLVATSVSQAISDAPPQDVL